MLVDANLEHTMADNGDPPLKAALVAGAVVLVFALLNLFWLENPRRHPELAAFSAEHGNIAASLVLHGRFADPFVWPSGPTAWEPPVYPLYMAAVFFVAGVKTTASLWILMILDCGWMALAVAALAYALGAGGVGRAIPWLVAALISLVLLIEHCYAPVQSPAWFVAALDSLILACWAGVWRYPASRRRWWGLVLVCAIAPVTHLGSGAAAGALLLFLAWRARRPGNPLHGQRRWLAAALGALCLPAALWTVRNRVVLGAWYPVKSDGWFELRLTQEFTPNGLLSAATLLLHHPYCDPVQRARFATLKEHAYMERARGQAVALLRRHPFRYLRFVGHRLVNALAFTQDSWNAVPCGVAASDGDLIRLQAASLGARISRHSTFYWASLDLPPRVFAARLAASGVVRRRALFDDWFNAREALLAYGAEPLQILTDLALSGLPMLCLLLYFLLRFRRAEPVVFATAMFYLVALTPNILVSHYSDYQFTYLVLLAGFVALLLGEIEGRVRQRFASTAL